MRWWNSCVVDSTAQGGIDLRSGPCWCWVAGENGLQRQGAEESAGVRSIDGLFRFGRKGYCASDTDRRDDGDATTVMVGDGGNKTRKLLQRKGEDFVVCVGVIVEVRLGLVQLIRRRRVGVHLSLLHGTPSARGLFSKRGPGMAGWSLDFSLKGHSATPTVRVGGRPAVLRPSRGCSCKTSARCSLRCLLSCPACFAVVGAVCIASLAHD